jgi:hypothetical protein
MAEGTGCSRGLRRRLEDDEELPLGAVGSSGVVLFTSRRITVPFIPFLAYHRFLLPFSSFSFGSFNILILSTHQMRFGSTYHASIPSLGKRKRNPLLPSLGAMTSKPPLALFLRHLPLSSNQSDTERSIRQDGPPPNRTPRQSSEEGWLVHGLVLIFVDKVRGGC